MPAAAAAAAGPAVPRTEVRCRTAIRTPFGQIEALRWKPEEISHDGTNAKYKGAGVAYTELMQFGEESCLGP
ncbi:unnamed protein product [Merluccius merluccius]